MKIGNDWDIFLNEEKKKPYFIQLLHKINEDSKIHTIYPKEENIFQAFKHTSYKEVKVVILGQDPYHQKNQAHGLAFSVPKGVKIPHSLHNIFLELVDDVKIDYPQHGNLEAWAKQGVFLLNTVLTVRDNEPGSHRNIGWEIFTDNTIKLINLKQQPVVFLLWGNDAKKKIPLITNPIHKVLTSAHPSPLSAYGGFFGCKHFSQANEFLIKNNLKPINWQI